MALVTQCYDCSVRSEPGLPIGSGSEAYRSREISPYPDGRHRNAAGFFVRRGMDQKGGSPTCSTGAGGRRVDALVADGRGVDLGEGGVGPGADASLVDFGTAFDKVCGQG